MDGTYQDAQAISRNRLREIETKITEQLSTFPHSGAASEYTVAHLEESVAYITEVLDAAIVRENANE